MGENASANAVSKMSSDQFEALYLALRRRLLLQCFALTGDLSAARSGVREAFIAARQQWRRVGALDHPEAWIRQRAMNVTQRRHVPHRRRASDGLNDQQIAVLKALSDLKDGERKALILHHLGDLDALAIGRAQAITERSARQRLDNAEGSFARARGCERALITEELRSLAPIVTHPGLPRAHAIHDRAHRRARVQVVLGVAIAAALATVGGLLIGPTTRSDALALIDARPVERAMFLSAAQVDAALPGTIWQETGTSTNTAGSGLHDVCQRERFADNNAAGTWVRQFQSSSPGTSLTQRTEVSLGNDTAQRTYKTTLAWYGNCSQTAAQLISAAQLKGVGNQAWLLTINVANPATTYQVVVARSGLIVSTLVLATPSKAAHPASSAALAELGRTMTQSLCQASASETCPPVKRAEAIAAVPPVVEYPGMLIASDLPTLANVVWPWNTSAPVIGGDLTAVRTFTCDTGALSNVATKTRTFVILEKDSGNKLVLPPGFTSIFGVTETIGTYPSAAAASTAVSQIGSSLSSCHKHQIGTQVDQQQHVVSNDSTPAATIWHETKQANAKGAEVTIWVGLTQYGRSVAQVMFIPTTSVNMTAATFVALTQRAAQRLTQQ